MSGFDLGMFNPKPTMSLVSDMSKAASSSGIWDTVKNVGNTVLGYGKTGVEFLNTNKDAFTTVGGLAGSYFDYQSNKAMQGLAREQIGMQRDAYNNQIKMQGRSIKRQEKQENNMGNAATAMLAGQKKKKQYSLNTPYTGLAGYGNTAPIGP